MPTHRVTAAVLNARSGPGTSARVLARLPRGTGVERLDASPDGRWLRVRAPLVDGALEAWVSARYLEPDVPEQFRVEPEAPWLAVARGELGVAEYPGEADNPRIVAYHAATTLGARDDEVPWCSSFVSWCMERAGERSTRSAAARSWLAWGRPLEAPRPGCVAVFRRVTRYNPHSAHVALFLRSRGVVVEVLGGNQRNRVGVDAYAARAVLGYRWPAPR